MLSAETTPEFKGRVFGFHRGFDTLGAVVGPAAALMFLLFFPGEYRFLFLLAFVPGVAAIALTLSLRETLQRVPTVPRASFLGFMSYWKESSPAYRRLVVALLVFAMVNSSDLLLLLLLREQGASDRNVILAYIFYNIVYAVSSYPLGSLADRYGMRRTYMFGLVLFAIVYAGATRVQSFHTMLLLLGLYGLYAASTEGISKAWITNLVPRNEAATAIGFFTGLQSIAALCASSLAGLLWYMYGAHVPFLVSAMGAVGVLAYFVFARMPDLTSRINQ
jgi:MFS family permease